VLLINRCVATNLQLEWAPCSWCQYTSRRVGAGTRMPCVIHSIVHKSGLINGEIVHGARYVRHDSFNLHLKRQSISTTV